MKKQKVYFSIAVVGVVLIAMITVFAVWYANRDVPATVIVNGQEIKCDGAVITKVSSTETCRFPVLPVLKALGAEVTWVDDSTAEIIFEFDAFNRGVYILSLTDETLTAEDGYPFGNLLSAGLGSRTGYCEAVEHDLIADEGNFRTFFFMHKVIIEISGNRRDGTIEIVYPSSNDWFQKDSPTVE